MTTTPNGTLAAQHRRALNRRAIVVVFGGLSKAAVAWPQRPH